MVITHISGGLGNQFFQYAAGRRLAHKWNSQLKIDLSFYEECKATSYILDSFFNVKEKILSSKEDIERLANLVPNNSLGREKNTQIYLPEVLDYPDNVHLRGCWENEHYFADISDILREEFTLKQPLGVAAQHWREKILAADCSVSLHVRHGDFAYGPQRLGGTLFAIMPFDYYYECVNRLKQEYENLTLFVFSNNLNWCKENFHPGVPVEFVEGEGLQDFEELWLMSLCKHNIIANSTFSWWGAWLNRNPDKKVFVPIPSTIVGTKETYRHFSAERNENSPLESDRWIKVPFDFNNQSAIKMRPYFSLLLVVNDDAATLGETLGSILAQDYKFYELIIIDNASTDGSGQICRQAANASDKVTLIKLWNKIFDGAAYNKALDLAQGDFVLFLKGNDRMFSNALTSLYLSNEHSRCDVVNYVAWLREDDRGGINLANKKFALEADAAFRSLQGKIRGKFDKPTLFKIFATNGGSTPLAAKVFKRDFLADKKIRFDESADAIQMFTAEAMLNADEMIFTPQVFYIAPKFHRR